MSKYKNPQSEWAYQQGRLDVLHELMDLSEVAEDKSDEMNADNQWQRDSVELELVHKFLDAERVEAQLNREIAGNKLTPHEDGGGE